MVQFKRAERKKAKLRLALAGPAGSGKTYGALLVAFGLGGKIAMIDTENHSGELYSHLGDYDVAVIDPPFVPEKYTEAIREAERLGYDTIIIDSLTHAWAGQGGLLDVHGHIADKSGNSWTAWRQVTPRHFELVEAMLQSKCHVIATMRSKMDYMQTEENGKKVVKKVGMNPIQRDGMEYEFTVFMDIDMNHLAQATKDRTSIFDGQVFKITPEVSKKLLVWLEAGAQAEPQIPVQSQKEQSAEISPPAQSGSQKGITGDKQNLSGEINWDEIPFTKEPVSPKEEPQRPPNGQGQATQAQIKKIFATAKEIGLGEDDLKVLCKDETGKESSRDLTKAEASKFIDALLGMAKNRAFVPPPPAGGGNGNGNRRRLF